MANKLNPWFMLLLLGGSLFSCQENELEETAAESISVVENATVSPLVFSETFEGPAPFCDAHNTGFSRSHSFSVVDQPVFSGHKAGCFKLKASDPEVSGGTRAEVTVIKDGIQKEMWYSFAVLFPADGFAFDSKKEVISQWHQLADVHLGEQAQSPATSLIIHKDRFILETGYSTRKVTDGVPPDNRKSFDLGEVTKDTWHSFVFHFIHTYKSDGLLEIWHNGEKMVTYNGGNMYNSVDLPKWKLGIYKWKWNGDGTTDTQKRLLYYDNIKVGNNTATYADMLPSNTDQAACQHTDDSYIFVNAETEQDLIPVANGTLLIQNELGTQRISVRANLKDPVVQSVQFVLKGPRDFTYTDNKPPFALFGDDGNGNYYYGGTPLPRGEYTIWITPYDQAKANGNAGKTFQASFRINKY